MVASSDTTKAITESYKLMLLIRAFMTHGHMVANIDPLNLAKTYAKFSTYAEKFKIPEQ
jgi:2-oxoglutarate dehydrogenase complex dehydrogenase (E1) component-like enzyme